MPLKLNVQDCHCSDIAKADGDFDDGIDDKLLMTCANIDVAPGENGNIDEVTAPEQKGEPKNDGPKDVNSDDMVTEEEILGMITGDKTGNDK